MGTTASFFFMGKFNTELSSTKKERKVGCHAPARELSYHSSSSLAGASLAPWSASVLWPNQPFLCVLLLLRESSSEPHRPRHIPPHCLRFESPAPPRLPCLPSSSLIVISRVTSAARLREASRPSVCGSGAPGLEIPGPGNRMYCK